MWCDRSRRSLLVYAVALFHWSIGYNGFHARIFYATYYCHRFGHGITCAIFIGICCMF
jgi:hypothetical protein